MLKNFTGLCAALVCGATLVSIGGAASAQVAGRGGAPRPNRSAARAADGPAGRAAMRFRATGGRGPESWRAPLASATDIWAFNTNQILWARHNGTVMTESTGAAVSGEEWVTGPHGEIRLASDPQRCLNVPRAAYKAGVAVVVSKCEDAASEQFLTTVASGHSVVFALKPAASKKLCLAFNQDPGRAAVVLVRCAAVMNQAWSAVNLYGFANTIASFDRGQLSEPPSRKAGPDLRAEPVTQSLSQYWYVTYDGSISWDPSVLPLLHPVTNGAECAALSGTEASGTALVLQSCSSPEAEQFLGIEALGYSNWMIATPDAKFCVRIAGRSGQGDAVVLGACVGDGNDQWNATLNLDPYGAMTFSALYPGTGPTSETITVTGTGAHQRTLLEPDTGGADQVWAAAPAAVGSAAITLRPLTNLNWCLTAAAMAAGSSVSAQPCTSSADQEFLRAASGINPAGDYTYDDLIPYEAGTLCVTVSGGISTGHAIVLETCSEQQDQTWSTWQAFYNWTGAPTYFNEYPVIAGSLPSPGPLLALANETSAGAQAVLQATSKGSPAQMWVNPAVSGGFEFSPVYDTGWCLAAPNTTAGTALTLAPCNGTAAQAFSVAGLSYEYVEYKVDGMCLAAGTTSGGVTPAVLEPCSASDTAEQWWSYPAG
jgi:hypothetical protein